MTETELEHLELLTIFLEMGDWNIDCLTKEEKRELVTLWIFSEVRRQGGL